MTQLEQKILNELSFTKVGETNDQKAKRIAESVAPLLEHAYNAGGDRNQYEWQSTKFPELAHTGSPIDPGYEDFEGWRKKENI